MTTTAVTNQSTRTFAYGSLVCSVFALAALGWPPASLALALASATLAVISLRRNHLGSRDRTIMLVASAGLLLAIAILAVQLSAAAAVMSVTTS